MMDQGSRSEGGKKWLKLKMDFERKAKRTGW